MLNLPRTLESNICMIPDTFLFTYTRILAEKTLSVLSVYECLSEFKYECVKLCHSPFAMKIADITQIARPSLGKYLLYRKAISYILQRTGRPIF